jgi:hypothetical protein
MDEEFEKWWDDDNCENFDGDEKRAALVAWLACAELLTAKHEAELAATRAAVLEQAAEECVKLYANCDKSNVACHVLDGESIRALITQPDALAEVKRAASEDVLKKAAIAICWRCQRPQEYRNIAADGTHEQIATGNHEWCDARLIYDMLRAPVSKPKEKPDAK